MHRWSWHQILVESEFFVSCSHHVNVLNFSTHVSPYIILRPRTKLHLCHSHITSLCPSCWDYWLYEIKKIWFWNSLQSHNILNKFQQNTSSCSQVEACGQTDMMIAKYHTLLLDTWHTVQQEFWILSGTYYCSFQLYWQAMWRSSGMLPHMNSAYNQ
jgi:hypothetical protein